MFLRRAVLEKAASNEPILETERTLRWHWVVLLKAASSNTGVLRDVQSALFRTGALLFKVDTWKVDTRPTRRPLHNPVQGDIEDMVRALTLSQHPVSSAQHLLKPQVVSLR